MEKISSASRMFDVLPYKDKELEELEEIYLTHKIIVWNMKFYCYG